MAGGTKQMSRYSRGTTYLTFEGVVSVLQNLATYLPVSAEIRTVRVSYLETGLPRHGTPDTTNVEIDWTYVDGH